MIDAIFRESWSRIVASLTGLLGDVELAEEAAQEAFSVAAERWPRDGIPNNPTAWLLTTAKRKAIDAIRRNRRTLVGVDEGLIADVEVMTVPEVPCIPDERLELIFACCHPALAPQAQVALVLSSVAGMRTRDIAQAFLVTEETMKRRLSRAKAKLRTAGIPFVRPREEHLPERVDAVLRVIYLIFNAGYSEREDLAADGIWLGRVLATLLPDEPDAHALLALMLLHESRRRARVVDGAFVPLPDQDRSRWDTQLIDEAYERLARALATGHRSAYVVQAEIAAQHSRTPVDWHQIVALYTELHDHEGSDVVKLNRAIAVSYATSPETALRIVEDLNIPGYHYLHSTRGELLDRLGRAADARSEFARAAELAPSGIERAFLAERLSRIADPGSGISDVPIAEDR